MEHPSQSIFRKAALDKLSSPEQLDQLMQVTTPKSWLALAAGGVLVLTMLIWGVAGSIPTKVCGRGILVKAGGVFVATARGEGSVARILVQEGGVVSNNQLLAVVSLPELDLKIRQQQLELTRLRLDLGQLTTYQQAETNKEYLDLAQQGETYSNMIADYGQQVLALSNRVQSQQELLKQSGAVSPIQVLETRNSLFLAQHDLARTRIALEQLGLTRLQADERRRQQLQDKTLQLEQANHQLQYLSNLYRLNSEVRSPWEGNVLEIMVKSNQLVTANMPMVSLQPSGRPLVAWLFLNPADGKLVRKNQDVAIAPASVKKEKFGLMVGQVREVTQFPVTPQYLAKILENPSLVAEFAQAGAPIAVQIWLERDRRTASGFHWTSQQGPDSPITSGTLCEGTVTLTNQAPITLVLPFLKKATGL